MEPIPAAVAAVEEDRGWTLWQVSDTQLLGAVDPDDEDAFEALLASPYFTGGPQCWSCRMIGTGKIGWEVFVFERDFDPPGLTLITNR